MLLYDLFAAKLAFVIMIICLIIIPIIALVWAFRKRNPSESNG